MLAVVADVERCLAALARAVLFNNAGVGLQARVLKATERDFKNVFGVNVFGAAYILKAFLNRAIQRGPAPSGAKCEVCSEPKMLGCGVGGPEARGPHRVLCLGAKAARNAFVLMTV